MSRYHQIQKTKRKNPVERLARITELKRDIKLYKSFIPERKKRIQATKWQYYTALGDLEIIKSIVEKYTKELEELINIEKGNTNE